MPNHDPQEALICATYARAGLDINNPQERCQFFEAHGTGTPAGDPQEANAIAFAFFGKGDNTLFVGSTNTVVGHTEGTAGIASLLKACLAAQHGVIPPNLLFDKLSPRVAPFYNHLKIITEAIPWPTVAPGWCRRFSLQNLACTLLEGRFVLPLRRAIVGNNKETLRLALEAAIEDGEVWTDFSTDARQGTQWSDLKKLMLGIPYRMHYHVQGVLENEPTFARLLKVDKAYHSHHMLPCALPYVQLLEECGCAVAAASSTQTGLVWEHLRGQHPYLLFSNLSSATSTFQWKDILRLRDLEWLNDNALQGQTVFPAAGYIMAMEVAMRVANDNNYEVELLEIVDMDISKAMVFEDDNSLVELNLSASVTGEPGQDGIITLKFFIDLCLSKESELLTSAKGEIIIAVANKSSLPAAVLLAPEEEHPQGNRVSIDSFYKELDLMGISLVLSLCLAVAESSADELAFNTTNTYDKGDFLSGDITVFSAEKKTLL
ncbi:beta-ketoacyl synthase domain-containing protein [Colletotrichum sp. SAR 10_66]|nr:beta-ketoacyl synthase domain-containing protein [Colletotrichum sp. SAR 10_66]